MIVRLLAAVVFLGVAAYAQEGRLPAAGEILDRVERGMEGVEDYTVTLEGEVSMDRVRVPKATILMYFKRPDKVHFSSASFSMVPRDGIIADVSQLRERYDARTVDLIDTAGQRWYKLQLAAKDPETRLRQIYVFVDAAGWTLRRLETSPYEGRVVSFDFDYQLVQGQFMLPSVLTATFGSVGTATDEMPGIPQDSPASQFREMQRMFRNGTVRFTYRDYRVNTGIPDSVFTSRQ